MFLRVVLSVRRCTLSPPADLCVTHAPDSPVSLLFDRLLSQFEPDPLAALAAAETKSETT